MRTSTGCARRSSATLTSRTTSTLSRGSATASSPSNPGQIARIADQYSGRWPELRVVLDGIDHLRLPPNEQQDWYRLRGAVEYRTNQRARAREIFEEAVERFPASGWLNFGLGQEYEFEGRREAMRSCFQRVRLADVGSRAVLVMARYAYLWDELELGQALIQPIFDTYYELKIADDMFLYVRGLPMFGEAFGYRATFARLAGDFEVARYELVKARSQLSDLSVESYERDLEATATGNWTPVLTHVESFLQPGGAGMRDGQLQMKRAVLRARGAKTVETAVAELDAFHEAPEDHAWLEDMGALARAESYRRFRMPDREEAALSLFWPRQALLFEPNHAFNFGMIDYQETLKPLYQARHHR